MEHIFLTRNAWDKCGGVPGLCLTLQEIGVPHLTLHGPPGIEEIFENAKKFVVLRNMKTETPECIDGETWEDAVMKVSYVRIYKDELKPEEVAQEPVKDEKTEPTAPVAKEKARMIFTDTTDYFDTGNNNRRSGMYPSASWKSQRMELTTKMENNVMAYICKLQERAGTLDFNLCVDKGVKPGPLLGRLKNGFDVTLPNGNVVRADEVRGPTSPGSVFIFIDVPSESYLADFEKNEAFTPYQRTATKPDDIALVVVHFTPERVMEHPAYKKWIEKFSPSTIHWFVNERNQFSGYFSAHRIQRQLNEIDERVFPLLEEPHPALRHEMTTHLGSYASRSPPGKRFKVDPDLIRAQFEKFSEYPELGILTAYHMRPPKGFDRSLEPFSNPETAIEEAPATPEVLQLIEKFKEEAKKVVVSRTAEERAKEFPKIITFGTGSCIPNKTRNVSSNLIHFSDTNCALLDCGEGTLGQLIRFYGRAGADEVLKKLRMIYVSHLHADHHLGLIDILNRRRILCKDKVLLLAPFPISKWLAFYNYRIEEIDSLYDLFSCDDLVS